MINFMSQAVCIKMTKSESASRGGSFFGNERKSFAFGGSPGEWSEPGISVLFKVPWPSVQWTRPEASRDHSGRERCIDDHPCAAEVVLFKHVYVVNLRYGTSRRRSPFNEVLKFL